MWPAVPTTRFLRDMTRSLAAQPPGGLASKRFVAHCWSRYAMRPGGSAARSLPPVHALQLRRQVRLHPERLLDLDRIHDRLSAKVIVENRVDILLLRHPLDAADP